jgi:hypothetical protein
MQAQIPDGPLYWPQFFSFKNDRGYLKTTPPEFLRIERITKFRETDISLMEEWHNPIYDQYINSELFPGDSLYLSLGTNIEINTYPISLREDSVFIEELNRFLQIEDAGFEYNINDTVWTYKYTGTSYWSATIVYPIYPFNYCLQKIRIVEDSLYSEFSSHHTENLFKQSAQIRSKKGDFLYKSTGLSSFEGRFDSIESEFKGKKNKRYIEIRNDSSGALVYVKDEKINTFDNYINVFNNYYDDDYPKSFDKKEYVKKEIEYFYNEKNQLTHYQVNTIMAESPESKKRKKSKQTYLIKSNCDSCAYEAVYERVESPVFNTVSELGDGWQFWSMFQFKGKRITQELVYDSSGILKKIIYKKKHKELLSRHFEYNGNPNRIKEIIVRHVPDLYFKFREGYIISYFLI